VINTSEAQLGGVVGPAIIAASGKRLPKPISNLHQWVDTSPPESWYEKRKILYVSEPRAL
jgi:hypothetical protein